MTVEMPADVTPEMFKRMRKLTLKKLGVVCKQLEEELAGQNVTLTDLPLPGDPDPGWTKLIRLRKYKQLLNDTLKRMSDGPYGFCAICAEPIRGLELQEMPWAESCSPCAAKGRTIIAGKSPDDWD